MKKYILILYQYIKLFQGSFYYIYNWRVKEKIKFNDTKEGKKMKFDFVIGNPPYQETMDGTSDKPVYNYFMDEAYKIADKL